MFWKTSLLLCNMGIQISKKSLFVKSQDGFFSSVEFLRNISKINFMIWIFTFGIKFCVILGINFLNSLFGLKNLALWLVGLILFIKVTKDLL